MTAPKPNAELAWRAYDAGQFHGNLRMAYWASRPDGDNYAPVGYDDLARHECGTTACLAGWGAVLSGYKINQNGEVLDGESGDLVSDEMFEFAADMFGIGHTDADRLFFSGDDELETVVTEIFGPRPESYGTGCHCNYLGEGMPEHAPSPLCQSLRPDADGGEIR